MPLLYVIVVPHVGRATWYDLDRGPLGRTQGGGHMRRFLHICLAQFDQLDLVVGFLDEL